MTTRPSASHDLTWSTETGVFRYRAGAQFHPAELVPLLSSATATVRHLLLDRRETEPTP